MSEQLTQILSGIAKHTLLKLKTLNIFNIQDLLFHFPLRYQDRTQLRTIDSLLPDQEVVVEGIIQTSNMAKIGKKSMICTLSDSTETLFLKFFNLLPFQKQQLKIGNKIRCFGMVRITHAGFEMQHPEFQLLNKPLVLEQYLTPIYPATEGLSQYMLRKLTTQALQWVRAQKNFAEILPEELLPFKWPSIEEALLYIHRPPKSSCREKLLRQQTGAHQRLIFEELLVHRMSLLRIKQQFQAQTAIPLVPAYEMQDAFKKQLPFQLTAAQERVIKEIEADLFQAKPMLRLVQGDVGCGKTVVAAMILLHAIACDYQVVLMAPTELLAEQHFSQFTRWFAIFNIRLAFLSSEIKGRERKQILNDIATGAIKLIIGTHAVFQDEVKFSKLILIIVDEQHRFGVEQRALLRKKGMQANQYPHQLVMTATPIPRTLAMSLYADLDYSQINELPQGRTPISTIVIANNRRMEVIDRIRAACINGSQVYWVCSLIEDSEAINAESAIKTAEQLQQLLTEFKLGLVHGRLNASEKEKVMQSFKRGELQVLVATTVIEVGVDVPNASVMVIENAERLGLSQLHQLRGRVGRGAIASYCILLYQYPLSKTAKERLQVMRKTTDGFVIAEKDLQLRGPGEVLGTRQTGELSFRITDLCRDAHLLTEVQNIAAKLLAHHPNLVDLILQRWFQGKEIYGKV